MERTHTVYHQGIIVGHYADLASANRVAAYRGGMFGAPAASVGKAGNTSIHPIKPMKAPRPAKLTSTTDRLRAALSAHIERHPNDTQSVNRLAALG